MYLMEEERNHERSDGVAVLRDAQGDANEDGVEDDACLESVGPDQILHAVQGPFGLLISIHLELLGRVKAMHLNVRILWAGPPLIQPLVELLVQEPFQCEGEQAGRSCKGHGPAQQEG